MINWTKVWRQFDRRSDFKNWDGPGGQSEILFSALFENGAQISPDKWKQINQTFDEWFSNQNWDEQQDYLENLIEKQVCKFCHNCGAAQL